MTASTPSAAHSHIHLIYAAALRQTRDPALAEDITQAVLLIHLRKQRDHKLPPDSRLVGWLLKVTHYVVQESRRESARRLHRELRAAKDPVMHATPADPILKNVLDSALLSLNAADRELLARRYLQGESVSCLAATIGLSENTTTKRLTRALEKLRLALHHRGITESSALLTLNLSAEQLIRSTFPSLTTHVPITPLANHLARTVFRKLALHQLLAIAVISVTIVAAIATTTLLFRPSSSSRAAATNTTDDESLLRFGSITEQPSDQLLADLLTALAANRQKLHTLQFDATASYDAYDNGIKTAAGATEGEVSIEIAGQRRFRLDIISNHTSLLFEKTSTWTDTDESFVIAWDGQLSTLLFGPPLSAPSARTTHFPDLVDGHILLALHYSMHLMQNETLYNENKSLPNDPLDPDTLHRMRLTARKRLVNDHELVELETRFNPPTAASLTPFQIADIQRVLYTYWFDPARGYALIASQEGLENLPPFDQTLIDTLTQISPGIYFPTHAHTTRWYRIHGTDDRALFSKESFTATAVTANPPLPPSLFHINIPAGVPHQNWDPDLLPPTTSPTTQN